MSRVLQVAGLIGVFVALLVNRHAEMARPLVGMALAVAIGTIVQLGYDRRRLTAGPVAD